MWIAKMQFVLRREDIPQSRQWEQTSYRTDKFSPNQKNDYVCFYLQIYVQNIIEKGLWLVLVGADTKSANAISVLRDYCIEEGILNSTPLDRQWSIMLQRLHYVGKE